MARLVYFLKLTNNIIIIFCNCELKPLKIKIKDLFSVLSTQAHLVFQKTG